MSGQSFLLHTVIITPACQWILQSGKFRKPFNLYYAIAFLILVAAAGEYSNWHNAPPNHYEVLQIPRTVSAGSTELKRAYTQLSKKFHPDKNKSPDAEEQFRRIAEAYEILNDASVKMKEEHSTTTLHHKISSLSLSLY